MNAKNFFLVFFLFSGLVLFAQKGAVKANLVTSSSYMREIPALSSMDNIIAAKGFGHVAPPKRRGTNTVVPGKGFPKGGDPLLQSQKNASQVRTADEIASFDAHAGTVLNDATGAIGPNHYVYAFNSGFGILDRSGNVLVPEASLGTIFPGETLGDPVVMYDNFAERFIIMEFSNTPNGFLIAIGKGPDPVNDGWYTYRFNTGTFPDYEKLSIWSDGYYITANKDQNAPDSNNVVFVVERDQMLAGNTSAQMIGFPLPGAKTNGFYSPGGFNATGTSLPPVGVKHSIVYLQDDSWGGVSQDHLKVWTTTIDWTNPSSSTISQPQEITTTPFDSVFDGGSFQNLDEPGSGPDIDALQATMMFMTNYRRFGTHNSVVLNFVVDLDGNDSLAGIRWYELRQNNDNDPWTIYQEGTYTQPDGHSAFCGSIGMDALGNIGLAYTIVSTTKYTSLRYTGRLASDPLGTMTVAEKVSADGDSQNNRRDGRYGDYGQLTIDPLDDKTFWHISEYMKGPDNVRKSHVVAFRLAPAVVDNEPPTAPANLASENTTARETTLSWTASTDNIGVVGYDVYQDNTLIKTVTETSFTVAGLTPLTTYTFYVKAKDASNNQSEASNTIRVTTLDSTVGPGCKDGIAAPYSESFENTIGAWEQSQDDDIDWELDADGTPSRRTGPGKAANGTHYLYVEASVEGVGYPNKRAVITSPCFDLNDAASAVFSFEYHMYGSSDMGTLEVEASNDEGETWTSVWNRSGNQGNVWRKASIDLSAYIGSGLQLRFNRVTGGSWRADVAIDDVKLTAGDTGSSCASQDVTVTITFDNYPQETSWKITDGTGAEVASKTYSNANPDGSTVVENIRGLSEGTYTFTIEDSFGDGICCSQGEGSYTVASASGEIVSGGDFDRMESKDFCVKASKKARLETYALTDKESVDPGVFSLYPNPAKNVLKINVKGKTVDQIKIFSMYGMLVKEIEGTKEEIDVSDLSVGTYFVRFMAEDIEVTRRFVKE
ncbi:T9SS type A sorting domain-containing protein [Aquimarina sp. TRL1]|uniref:T9SS-dependent choice-of-anchor J family protein n=1 Tax=Aquimarina sp. (strain TRL1) TaxID=2736252 RepID=UPI001C378353|nr:T9SS type A sorting domain-containing protein [Aquimarina sp. TRL1]